MLLNVVMFSVCLLVRSVERLSTHGTASPTNFVCEISMLLSCANFSLCVTHTKKKTIFRTPLNINDILPTKQAHNKPMSKIACVRSRNALQR